MSYSFFRYRHLVHWKAEWEQRKNKWTLEVIFLCPDWLEHLTVLSAVWWEYFDIGSSPEIEDGYAPATCQNIHGVDKYGDERRTEEKTNR